MLRQNRTEQNRTEQNRIEWIDFLRTLGAFFVVTTHVAQQIWCETDISTYNWEISNIYESFVICAVPIFVMISGSLLLEKDLTNKNTAIKNLKKNGAILIAWSFIYFLESLLLGKEIEDCVYSVIYGPLWYLFMMIGIYLIMPFLKVIIKSKLINYFLVLSFVFSFCIPTIIKVSSLWLRPLYKVLSIIIDDISMNFCLGYSGYYCLGYVLFNKKIEKKAIICICVLGVLSFIVLPCITSFASIQKGNVIDFYDNMNLGIYFESIMIFCLVKEYYQNINIKIRKVFLFISKYTLGIYLVHKIVIDILNEVLFDWNKFNLFIWIPTCSILVFAISFVLVYILKKINLLRNII